MQHKILKNLPNSYCFAFSAKTGKIWSEPDRLNILQIPTQETFLVVQE